MNNRQSNQNFIPNNFNWKIIPYIANDKSINNEQKAKNYFKKHCTKNSPKLKLYFNKFYNIPKNFDDNLYIEYLKSVHDVNLKPGEIDYEKLCLFYNKVGKHKYPLNNSYFKLYYNLPENFDEVAYKESYKENQLEFNSDMNKFTNIFEFYGELGKDKYPINDNYFKMKFKLPDHFDFTCYKKIYNLNSLNVNDTINHYLKNKKLDENYFKLYYEIPDNFDENIFKQYSKITISNNDLNLYYKTIKSELDKNNIPEEYLINLFQLNKNYTINNLIDAFPELNKNLNNFNIYDLFVKNKEKYTFNYSKYGKKNENNFINILSFFEYHNNVKNIIKENKLKSELDFLMWYLTNINSYKFNNGNNHVELENYKSKSSELSDMDIYLNIIENKINSENSENSNYQKEIDKIKLFKVNNYIDLFNKEITLFLKNFDKDYDFNIINKINKDLKEETIFYKIENYLKKKSKFDVNYVVYNKFVNEYFPKLNNKTIIILLINDDIKFNNLIDNKDILNDEIENYYEVCNIFENDNFISFVKKNELYNSYCNEKINNISKFLNMNEIIKNKDFSYIPLINNIINIKFFYIKHEIENEFNNKNFNFCNKKISNYHYFILDEIDLNKYYLMYLLLNCEIEGNIILHVNKDVNFDSDFLKNKNISFELVYIKNNLDANDFIEYVVSNNIFKLNDILINSIYIFEDNIISTNLYNLEKNNFIYILGIFLIEKISKSYNQKKFCLCIEALLN